MDDYFMLGDPDALTVAPVKRGKWEHKEQLSPYRFIWYCSECGEAGDKHFNYCPWCGARMDGER